MSQIPAAHLFQINASSGGVPKYPLFSATVTVEGLAEDRQADTRYHGGPTRALCLYSLERILALQAEGHPIFPGAIGENLTISGLHWDAVIPGSRWRLGKSIAIEITSYTIPCRKIRAAFREHRFPRVSPDYHPGWARTYAAVLVPGRLAVGDPISPLDSGN